MMGNRIVLAGCAFIFGATLWLVRHEMGRVGPEPPAAVSQTTPKVASMAELVMRLGPDRQSSSFPVGPDTRGAFLTFSSRASAEVCLRQIGTADAGGHAIRLGGDLVFPRWLTRVVLESVSTEGSSDPVFIITVLWRAS